MGHNAEQLYSLIKKFRLSIVMATNQNEEFKQILYACWRITYQTVIKTFCQNICGDLLSLFSL